MTSWKGKENDEFILYGSVARYGPRTSCRRKLKLSAKFFTIVAVTLFPANLGRRKRALSLSRRKKEGKNHFHYTLFDQSVITAEGIFSTRSRTNTKTFRVRCLLESLSRTVVLTSYLQETGRRDTKEAGRTLIFLPTKLNLQSFRKKDENCTKICRNCVWKKSR